MNRDQEIERRKLGGVSKVDLDSNDSIKEMVSLEHRLIIVSKKRMFQIRTANTLDPEVTTKNLPWENRHLLPFGASDEIVARSILQANDLLKLGVHEDGTKYKVNAVAFEVLLSLASMLVIKDRVCNRIEEIKNIIDESPSEFLNLPSTKSIPNIPLLEIETRQFVFEAKRILNQSSRLFSILADIDVSEGHFHTAAKRIKAKYGGESNLHQFMESISIWVNTAIIIRNAVEHPKIDKNFEVFDFQLAPTGQIRPPSWKLIHPDYQLSEYQDLASFFQDFLESSMNVFDELLCHLVIATSQGPFPISISYLAPEDIDPERPVKYKAAFEFRPRESNENHS